MTNYYLQPCTIDWALFVFLHQDEAIFSVVLNLQFCNCELIACSDFFLYSTACVIHLQVF